MIPRSLSASSAMVAEACLARWVAEYFWRAEQPSGSAANLGTLCHAVLEEWVTEGCHKDEDTPFDIMEKMYAKVYYDFFDNDQRYEEGLTMLKRWYKRSHPLPNRVLSTEVKEEFPLKVGGYEIPFRYIWDRADAIGDEVCDECGECPDVVEVVDYKTVMVPISPQGLEDRIQARCYAVAAQIRYPHAKRVWVTFDLLRHDPVGIVFSREQNIATYKYIKNLAKRILATDAEDAPETINPDCQWCIRKHECATLAGHAAAGGVYAIEDPKEAANRRFVLYNQKRGIEKALTALDELIINHCEKEDIIEFETDQVELALSPNSRRYVNPERAARVIGPELMRKYGQLRMGDIDVLLSGDELSDEQKAQLKGLITRAAGSITVKTKPKNPID